MENVKRKSPVTLPSLSRKNHDTLYVCILSALQRSESVDESDDSREPATTCRVLNLDDGKLYTYVVSVVAVSALKRYPGGYLGRCFEIIHAKDKAPGKSYYDVEVWEIDAPPDLDQVLARHNQARPKPGTTG